MAGASPFERANAALSAQDPEALLVALLEAWRETRAPSLAQALAPVSRRVAGTRTPPLGKSLGEKQAAWLALEGKHDPADLPLLLQTFAEVRVAEATARLTQLEARPEDPRISEALVGLLAAPPWRGKETLPFWTRVCDLISRTADERAVAKVKGVAQERARLWGSGIGKDMARMLPSVASGILSHLERSGRELLPGEEALVKRVEEAFLAPKDATAEALLARIQESPLDDDLRSIYADRLQEDGDARGELIALQLARARTGRATAAARKREKELLASHLDDWLGPLKPALARGSWVFERGFLAAARFRVDTLPVGRAVIGRPEWATVERLDCAGWQGGDLLLELLRHPVMRSLRVLEAVPPAILEGKGAFPRLESLGLRTSPWGRYSTSLVDALAGCRCMPRLRRLSIAGVSQSPANWGKVWPGPLLATVKELELEADPIDPWLQELLSGDGHGLAAFLARSENLEARLTRGDSGRLDTLEVTERDGRPLAVSPASLVSLLDLPAGSLRRVAVDPTLTALPGVQAAMDKFLPPTSRR